MGDLKSILQSPFTLFCFVIWTWCELKTKPFKEFKEGDDFVDKRDGSNMPRQVAIFEMQSILL